MARDPARLPKSSHQTMHLQILCKSMSPGHQNAAIDVGLHAPPCVIATWAHASSHRKSRVVIKRKGPCRQTLLLHGRIGRYITGQGTGQLLAR